jgi:hypothetical protein
MAEGSVKAAGVLIGWASRDVTPTRPNALRGQFYTRISEGADDPITVTAMAIESASVDGPPMQAIMISCDRAGTPAAIVARVHEALGEKLNDFDPKMLVMNATHTHSAPTLDEGLYPPQDDSVQTPTEYADEFVAWCVEAAAEAWAGRRTAGLSRAYGHAVVGHNRRACYEGNVARMYGKTDDPAFRGIEGYEDHGLNVLLTWDAEQKLTGMVVNIACPSQVSEHSLTVTADYWHETREELRRRFGADLRILPQCSAAGDQSPHLMLRKDLEESMRRRRGLTERQEIARRIANAVGDVLDGVRADIHTELSLAHVVETVDLPARLVTDEEHTKAHAERVRLEADTETEMSRKFRLLNRARQVIARYESQQPHHPVEVHVLRLGDVAIATNPFELYLDFGLRIKARSKALQTFLVQLACACDGYVPTQKAVDGGSYGAEVASNKVGPDGGQVLVERTVEMIDRLWA